MAEANKPCRKGKLVTGRRRREVRGCFCGRIAPSTHREHPRFGCISPNEDSLSRPRARCNHLAVLLADEIVVFGGKHIHECQSNIDEDENMSLICFCVVWCYNVELECWKKHLISDQHETIPRPRSSACAVGINNTVYMYGGVWDKYQYTSELWALSRDVTEVFSWTAIKFCSKASVPSPRCCHSGLQYDDMMWVFGGCGWQPDGFLHEHGEFIDKTNNQLLCFDPRKQSWSDVSCTGALPPPRFQHATALVDRRIILYGGLTPDPFANMADDINILDLMTFTWTRMVSPLLLVHGHLKHTLTRINDQSLLLYGGYIFDQAESADTCLRLELPTMAWSRLPYSDLDSRCGHSATEVGDGNIVIIGGYCDDHRTVWTLNDVKSIRTAGSIGMHPRSLQSFAKRAVFKHRETLRPRILQVPPSLRHCLEGQDATEPGQDADRCSECHDFQTAEKRFGLWEMNCVYVARTGNEI